MGTLNYKTNTDYSSWTDEELLNELKRYWGCQDFIFKCKIGPNSKDPEKQKAFITNARYKGRFLKYPGGGPIFSNVKSELPFGDFSIRFILADRSFRETINNLFLLSPDLSSLSELNPEIKQMRQEAMQKKAEIGKTVHTNAEKELFEWWGVSDCNFIGFYHYDEENDLSIVDDIRKPNFARIPYYPGDSQKKPITIHYPHKITGIKSDNYYLFNWKLSGTNYYNPYEIHIDFEFQPQPIRQQWFIEKLFDDRYNDKSKNFESSANFLDTLSKQLSAKESTFIYELLQNANDYPIESVPVDVEFHITDNYLLFMHSGDYFNVRNISGICGINEKEKSAHLQSSV